MPSDDPKGSQDLRNRLIGLGERSMAKSYYPELKRRLEDLERFRAVVDHANDAIFVFNATDWTLADVNETALTLLAVDRAESLGRHITAFFPQEVAERYAGAAQEHGQAQFRNGHLATWLTGALGLRVPTEITVTLHSFAGSAYAVVVARDITVRLQMEAELDKSRQLFASFMEHAPVIAFIKDLEGRYIFSNPALCAWLGLDAEDVLGHTDLDLLPQDVASLLRGNDRHVLEQGRPLRILEQVRRRGEEAPSFHQVSKFPLIQDGEPFALAGIAVDITAQVQAERSLQQSEERYRILAEYNHDMECWINPTGAFLYVSPSCERITGYPQDYFLTDSGSLERIIHENDLPGWRQFHSAGGHPDRDSLDYRIRKQDGELRWVNEVKREVMGGSGSSLGSRMSLRDITDRKAMELQLRHLALHDPLTGLANRTLCLDRIRQAMERARQREPYSFLVIFLDLDRFKVLNDSLGHAFGDQVLIRVAEALRSSVRGLDTVSRFGGDEFVLLLEELASPREAMQSVQRIRDAVSQPLSLDGHDMQLTASMGITLGVQDADTPEDLLRNANLAMHQAKKGGRNRFKVFTRTMLDHASRLLGLETDLRRAMARGEFFLVYQPIVQLDGQATLQGFEALVRWNHPEKGLISPGEFITVAEDTGIIVDLGRAVLRQACGALARWRQETPLAADLVMSVNLSPRQFSEAALVDSITAALKDTGLPQRALKLEITESAIMEDTASAVDRLRRLKSLGIALSIDDFGTGYSSMSSLQQFPLDTLKIDLSFVRRLEASQEDLEIVKAIISLAHSLQLQVVAEGVERIEQKTILTMLQCEFAQGYYYSKPLPEAQAREYLERCHTGCPVPGR